MPLYEYYCDSCKKTFTLFLSVAESEKASVECTHCNSREVKRQISSFSTVTSKKS